MKKLLYNVNAIVIALVLVPANYSKCQTPETKKIQDSGVSYKAESLITHGIQQAFIRVPEGEFMMGSNEKPNEQPVHRVKVASFDLATTEVTVRQFRAFVQATRYHTDADTIGFAFACCWRPKTEINWRNPGFLQEDNEPVVAISWNDAVAYCRWLSEETGKDYRLPSEAEWEYACHSGDKNISVDQLDSIAWYSENSSGRTHPVATKKCNSLGLYDMLGNAWEWTSDDYHDNYNGAPEDGKPWLTATEAGGSEAGRGYVKPGDGRVLRGGGWGLSNHMHVASYDLRVTSRPVFGVETACNNSGFRIARSLSADSSPGFITKTGSDSFTANGIMYDMVRIPAGQFAMGDEAAGQTTKPVHIVRFIRPVVIGKTEVTVRQFRSFAEKTGYITDAEKAGKCWDSDFRSKKTSARQAGINWKNPGFRQTENDPVTCVSWNDAMAFCEWLSRITGRRIRLPSEAEWEFASLDTTGTYYNSYPEIAWIYDNSGFTTHPVAEKKPNSNGLYDLLGNVSEWMMDIWHQDYEGAPSDGSSRLGEPSTARVSRGGSFEREVNEISRCARDWYNESEPLVGTGFRIVDTGISLHK